MASIRPGLRDRARTIPLHTVERYLAMVNGSIRDEYKVEGWRVALLPTSELRTCDTDVKGYPVVKGRKLSRFTEEHRDRLATENTDLAQDARRKGRRPMVVVVRDPEGSLYVMDGYSRNVAACFQHEPKIRAFILEEPNPDAVREKYEG